MRVDLPEPVWPMMPTNSPGSIARLTSSSAVCSKGVPGAVDMATVVLSLDIGCNRVYLRRAGFRRWSGQYLRNSACAQSSTVRARPAGASQPVLIERVEQARWSRGTVSPTPLQQLHLGEHLLRRAVGDDRCPSSMAITRSAWAASSMWWVMSTTVMPCSRLSAPDGVHHLPPALGVQHGGGLVQNDAVGAAWRCTPAMATRCFCPPESRWGACSRYSYMPTCLQRARPPGGGSPPAARPGFPARRPRPPPPRWRRSGCPGSGTPCPPCCRMSSRRLLVGGVHVHRPVTVPPCGQQNGVEHAWPAWICRSRCGPARPRSCPLRWSRFRRSSTGSGTSCSSCAGY